MAASAWLDEPDSVAGIVRRNRPYAAQPRAGQPYSVAQDSYQRELAFDKQRARRRKVTGMLKMALFVLLLPVVLVVVFLSRRTRWRASLTARRPKNSRSAGGAAESAAALWRGPCGVMTRTAARCYTGLHVYGSRYGKAWVMAKRAKKTGHKVSKVEWTRRRHRSSVLLATLRAPALA